MTAYATADFRETRPILVGRRGATHEAANRAISEYRILRHAYETALVTKYKKEPLVEWRGKRYPISILSKRKFTERDVIERLELNPDGSPREYNLPEAAVRLKRDGLLGFIENNPLVRNPMVDFVDSPIAHPSRLDLVGEKVTVWYQKSTYFNYVLTMLAMDVHIKREGKRLRDILDPGGSDSGWTLAPVERSLGGGTLGIVCFVKTRNGKFVVARRSSNVANAKNSLVPSCGGFLRWPTKGDKPPSMFWQARKHLEEEMSVSEHEIAGMECIGITRDLERAGHLDAHFYVEILPSFKELNSMERRTGAAHGTEIEKYIAVEKNRLANYISNPDAAPILMGSVYLLRAASLLSGVP